MSTIHRLLRLAFALLVVALAAASAPASAQQRVRIDNTATLRWQETDGPAEVRSNTVSLALEQARRPTRILFRLPAPGTTIAGMSCDATTFYPADIDAATFAASRPLAVMSLDVPMIIALEDATANRDPAVRDTVEARFAVGAAGGRILLRETAPDSGVFAGGAIGSSPDPALAACDIRRFRGQRLAMRYEGNAWSTGSDESVLVDPAGFVFDSRTGAAVDGAEVSLVDANGQPATVYGDDGTSRYPATMTSGAAVTDAGGHFYPGQAGRFRFPLTMPGTYFLKVTPPGGYTAWSTVDRTALAAVRDPFGSGYVLNEASFGGAIVLATEEPFIVDVPIDPSGRGALLLAKTASAREASPGDIVQYRLRLTNRDAAVARGVRLDDVLPTGLRYRIGSTRGADEPAVERDGRTLHFTMPDLPPGASGELTYLVQIAPGAPVGEALNQASAHGVGIASNRAAASVRLRPLLFTDALTIIGRVTEGDCGDPARRRRGVPGIRLLLEDGTFVVTDRDGLYHLEGVRPGTHVVQLDAASIPATHEAVACDVDTRQAGNPLSRFVEGAGGLVKRVDFQLRPTGRAAAAAPLLPIAIADDATASGHRDWLQGQAPGIAWLFPAADHNPRAPSLRVAIQHLPAQRVALTLDGVPTEAIAFDGTDAAGAVAVSRWSSLPLHPGDNRLEARVLGADGKVVATLARTVHFSGAPARATLDAGHSRLVADGLVQPLVAVRVTDADGRPVRAGTMIPYRVDQPYAAAVDPDRRTPGADGEAVARVVGDDGTAFLALQPTAQAGAVRATVTLADPTRTRAVELSAWLAPAQRDWVVVGFGKGSLGFETLSRHGRALPRERRDRVTTDGQIALYAKGRIRGAWLLTLAYDSDRPDDRTRGLLGTIDPDRYYTVYGDGGDQRYDAATRRRLFLRLERRQFYALFGDFETGLTDTRLTRYSRTLSGVKAAYEGRTLRAQGFAASVDTLYARDEIQGNGLSGPYRLSRRGIVPNSDKLSIETRDRYRSEVVRSRTQLTRHIDYDIDVDLGTIRFRQPILSRDADRNPVFVVVDYEVEGGRGGKLAAGGRVAARTPDRRVEIGVSGLRDDTQGAATVAGVDLTLRADAATEMRAEIATGGRGGLGEGIAWLAEVEHHGAGVDITGYARRQDTRFGVGQQNLVEAGTQKVGLDGRVALAPALTLTGTGWYQEQLAGAGRRVAGETKLEWRRGTASLFVGGQVAIDRGIDGQDRDSRLLTLGGARSLLGDRLVVTAQTQVAPGGDKASVDFPVRHQVTAAYRVKPGIRLLGGYEIAEGEDFVAHTAQVGFDVKPWSGAKLAATLNDQTFGENGARTFAQYGLAQSLPLGPRWTVDATLDASSTVKGRIAPGAVVNPFQPVAAGGFLGQDARNAGFVATTLGAAYRGADWRWNGRVEYRDADTTDRWGVTSNLVRALGAGRTLASGIKAYRIGSNGGATAVYAAADVALAWRPLDSRWSVLERFEVRHERADAGVGDGNVLGVPALVAAAGSAQITTRAINNLAVNYRTGDEGRGHGWEATLYYGAKYVAGRFAEDRFDGFIDTVGAEIRRDLGTRVDVGVQASTGHAWNTGTWSWSAGPSVGLSPAKDVWVSAGYNVAGYRDRDFEDDRYTRAGPYVTMRMKFDRSLFARASGR